jgi:hypothetical protein
MNIGDTRWHAHARRLITAAACAGTLVVAGGGVALATTVPVDTAPADSAAPADTAAPADSAAPAEPVAIAVTLTEAGIEGLPADLVAGIVDVTFTDETGAAGEGIDFTRVEPGTDVATFTEGLAPLFEGGPFPDFFLNNAGVAGHTITTLDAGEYIVWAELPSEDEDAPSDIVAVPLTVGEGDDDAVIPETDGSIRAGDYVFDADVTAGGTSVTFTNSSDNQFHHVALMDFGTNDPALVAEILPAFLEGEEDAPPPEGIDMEQVNPDFAGSPVFGPGSSGTFDVTFEEGHTYAALCFIQDRDGGLPHAIAHQMIDVFQVGAG